MKIIKIILTHLFIIGCISFINAQDISFTAVVESDASKMKGQMQFFVKDDLTAVVMSSDEIPGDLKIIYDFKSRTQTTLMENEGKKIAMVSPMINHNDETAIDEKDFKIIKTEDTKIISGYTCTKYIIEDKESTSEIWTTEELKYSYNDMFKAMTPPGSQKSQKKDMIPKGAEISGFPLEIVARAKKKGGNMRMTITNIQTDNIDEKVFSTEGYEVFDTGSMMR